MEYRAGMFVYALAFLLGVLCVQQLSILPTRTQLFIAVIGTCLACILAGFIIRRLQPALNKQFTLIYSFILLFIIGFYLSSVYASNQLSYRLSADLIGINLLVNGSVISIPGTDRNVQRFEFQVESYRVLGSKGNSRRLVDTRTIQNESKFPRKIRLSWYYGSPVNAADRWQLEVRLKPPHGFYNPGGFDYEAWLFQHGIHATGYVRKSAFNQRFPDVTNTTLLSKITGIRQSIGSLIEALGNEEAVSRTGSFALIKALAIGDKSSISKQQWRVLTNTGTSHLMAISGLHIGLAALFAFVLIRRSVPVFIVKHIPAQHVALVGGLSAALIYALIAGLSVPTQRAFIMLFILSIMLLIRRNHRPFDALGFALILVLLFDPLAVLSAGFWFSFSAVAVIFISFSSHHNEPSQQRRSKIASLWNKPASIIRQWIRLQLLISVFLMPLSLFMFQQVSLVSPLANLLLIPYVSFLVVPVVLLAITLSFISTDIAEILFRLSASLMDTVWPVLSYLSAQPDSVWVRGDIGLIKLLSATMALSLLYYSKSITNVIVTKLLDQRFYTRVLCSLIVTSLLLFVPLLISRNSELESGEYKITVLDVGQGSAAVLQTQHHVVVFDTGAKFSDKLDAGSNVVIPYLKSQGIKVIDSLVVSHGDNDHIGGAQAILDAYPTTGVIGRQIDNLNADKKQPCVEGFKWLWDGVYFEFLSPAGVDMKRLSTTNQNNQSCVLYVTSKSGSVLFTGDIEKEIEVELLRKYETKLRSDVLIVPHHGSKTSSSQNFIETVDAKISIFSVGYKNRYKLPNSKIMSMYESSNSQLLRTDHHGAISVLFTKDSGLLVEKYRQKAKKYWLHVIN